MEVSTLIVLCSELADASGTTAFSYDAEGNLTEKAAPAGTTTYTYDARNRLLTATDPAPTLAFTYDGDGVRLTESVDGVVTQFISDAALSNELVVQEITATDTRTHLHGLGVLESEDATGLSLLHPDSLRSTRLTADASGNLIGQTNYEAFGLIRTTSGVSPSFGYAGEQAARGRLLYLRARYYDPELGRFLQEDPVPGLAADSQGMNPYTYARDNPVMMTDPSGKTPKGQTEWMIGQGIDPSKSAQPTWSVWSSVSEGGLVEWLASLVSAVGRLFGILDAPGLLEPEQTSVVRTVGPPLGALHAVSVSMPIENGPLSAG